MLEVVYVAGKIISIYYKVLHCDRRRPLFIPTTKSTLEKYHKLYWLNKCVAMNRDNTKQDTLIQKANLHLQRGSFFYQRNSSFIWSISACVSLLLMKTYCKLTEKLQSQTFWRGMQTNQVLCLFFLSNCPFIYYWYEIIASCTDGGGRWWVHPSRLWRKRSSNLDKLLVCCSATKKPKRHSPTPTLEFSPFTWMFLNWWRKHNLLTAVTPSVKLKTRCCQKSWLKWNCWGKKHLGLESSVDQDD